MLTFPNVTPQVFALVLDQLRREGSTVTQTATDQYAISGEKWPLGTIRTNVSYDGATVTLDVVQPKQWEHAIGCKVQDAINAAQMAIARHGQQRNA